MGSPCTLSYTGILVVILLPPVSDPLYSVRYCARYLPDLLSKSWHSCLENPMDRVWKAIVHGVVRVGHDLVIKPHHHKPFDTLIGSQCEKGMGRSIWRGDLEGI